MCIRDSYEIVPGFVLSLFAAWLVSRADRTPEESLAQHFKRIEKGLD